MSLASALWWAKNHQAELILWSESNRHDARSGFGWVESLKTYFLSRCDRFVVPGKASCEYLQSLGSGERGISFAPNAVDNDWFHTQADNLRGRSSEFRARLALPPRFLLFVGRLIPEKGVFDLLEAYSRLAIAMRSEVGLVFAGDGPSKAELKRRAQCVPGQISFPGFLHREDLAGLYALAEALILPTHSDTWGLVVNEAMAAGLPVIASDAVGCVPDLVHPGKNGAVFPVGSIPDLRRLLREIICLPPEARAELGRRSREIVQAATFERVVDACIHALRLAATSAPA